MSKYWNARVKNTRRFRSIRALKQDRARVSQKALEKGHKEWIKVGLKLAKKKKKLTNSLNIWDKVRF